jgi:hypothetical protein
MLNLSSTTPNGLRLLTTQEVPRTLLTVLTVLCTTLTTLVSTSLSTALMLALKTTSSETDGPLCLLQNNQLSLLAVPEAE